MAYALGVRPTGGRRTWRVIDSSYRTVSPVPRQLLTAAQETIAKATPEQLNVLYEDLVPLLIRRGIPAEAIISAIANKADGMNDAVTAAKLAEKQLTVLRTNHEGLLRTFSKDTAVRTLVDPTSVSPADYVNPVGL